MSVFEGGTSTYRGRRAFTIENDHLRVSLLVEGGHIAEILHKRSGINPLWTPVWRSIEPSQFDASSSPEYGSGPDGRLLAGIMGHNLCLDIFGGPSEEEAAAGLTAHGEASVVPYEVAFDGAWLSMRGRLPLAGLTVERDIAPVNSTIRVRETIQNLSACDRPIGWTEHVTLGPPFLEKGLTELRSSATRSKVFETAFGTDDYLKTGAVFQWPLAPRVDGGTEDLRRFTAADISSGYTAHLMDPTREYAFFVAFSPRAHLAVGYIWKQRDFPWMGIWEENHSRRHLPWNGESLTCGLEFGVSPFPESRRAMIDRGRLFDVPTYRWIPARSAVTVEYAVVVEERDDILESLARPESSV